MNYFQHQTVNFIEGNPNITEVLSIKKIGQETGLHEPTVVPRLKPCFQLRPSKGYLEQIAKVPSHNGYKKNITLPHYP